MERFVNGRILPISITTGINERNIKKAALAANAYALLSLTANPKSLKNSNIFFIFPNRFIPSKNSKCRFFIVTPSSR